jgi:T1SS-143 domain-containing protein
MLEFIGIIRQIVGTFFVIDKNGEIREVHAGDKIYAGDKIVGDQFNSEEDYIIITVKNAQYDTKITGSNEYIFNFNNIETPSNLYDLPILLQEEIIEKDQFQNANFQEENTPFEVEPILVNQTQNEFIIPKTRENEPSHIYSDKSKFTDNSYTFSSQEYTPTVDRIQINPDVKIDHTTVQTKIYTPNKADDYIPNDIPKANNDFIDIYEDMANHKISSNLFTNDDLGNDYIATPVIGVSSGQNSIVTQGIFSAIGKYGTLTLDKYGNYTYTLFNDKLEVQQLNNDEFLNDYFTYTIEDSTSDQDSAVLSIKINGNNNDIPTLQVQPNIVAEAGLSSGTLHDNSNIVNSSFQISSIDGLEKIKIQNIDISLEQLNNLNQNNIEIITNYGKINLTNFDQSTQTIFYTYTLESTINHITTDGIDHIKIEIFDTDEDPDIVTKNLDITIIDDVPIANDDAIVNTISEGDPIYNGVNLLNNDISSSDGMRVLKFTIDGTNYFNANETITTPTGDLTVNSDGSWSFYAVNSFDHDQDPTAGSFDYIVVDSDNSQSMAHQTINLLDTEPNANPINSTITESNLPNGTAPNSSLLTKTSSLGIVQDNDEIVDIYFNQDTIDHLNSLDLSSNNQPLNFTLSNNNHTIDARTTQKDIFTITLDQSNYTFTLKSDIDHTQIHNDIFDIDFLFNIDDIDLDSTQKSFIVSIYDDAPTLYDDIELEVIEGENIISGNLFSNDSVDTLTTLHEIKYIDSQGVQQIANFDTLDDLVLNTATGELNINKDATWSFKSIQEYDHDNDPTLGSFSYTAIDGDGDISNWATQKITLLDTNPTANIENGSLNENNLFDGSDVAISPLSITKDLNITINKDDIADVKFKEVTTLGLTHNSIQLDYTIQDDGHTLIAKANDLEIFNIVLNNPTTPDGSDQSYTFTLLESLDHTTNGSLENIDIVVDLYDVDLQPTQENFTVSINDDLSVAIDETPLEFVEGNSSYSSNLFTNDTIGADDIKLHSFTYTDSTGTLVTKIFDNTNTQYTVNSSIDSSTMGELTVDQNGNFTFTPNSSFDHDNPNNTSANFVYTLIDVDGDISSAIQVINITDTEPTVGAVLGNLDEKLTHEAIGFSTDLGSLNITKAQDDISDVYFTQDTINNLQNQNITSNSLDITYTLDSNHQITATRSDNKQVFVVNILNPNDSTGTQQQYSITLYEGIDHGVGNTTKDLSFLFEVSDIDLTNTNGNFIITILDDNPTASSDLDDIDEGQDITTISTISDNLFDDDIGADITSTPVTGIKLGDNTTLDAVGNLNIEFEGLYGTINLDNEGNYTYTLDNTNLEVQSITTGETLNEVFTYTITDNDGDTSSSTLSITINGTDDNVYLSTPNQTVYEAGLSNGSANDDSDIINNGTFKLNALDTLDNIVINNTTITKDQLENCNSSHITIDTTEGILILNSYTMDTTSTTNDKGTITIGYTYTLKETLDHSNNDPIEDIITITLNDTDSDTQTSNLVISIVDDVPVAVDQVDISLIEGSGTYNGINLLNNDIQGSDGALVYQFNADGQTKNAGETITTANGDLTVNSDGSWSFTPVDSYDHDNINANNNLGSFTYTLIDADGDISNEATQNITLIDTDATLNPISINSVDEDDLSTGSDQNDNLIISSNLNIIKAADDINDVKFEDTIITNLQNLSLKSNSYDLSYALSDDNHTLNATANGVDIFTLTIDNPTDTTGTSQTYTFELKGQLDHPNDAQDSITIPFEFSVIDIDSTISSGNFQINIVDDIPTAYSQSSLSVVEGLNDLTGMIDLMDNDIYGADRDISLQGFTYTDETNHIVSGTFGDQMDTKYGKLTVNSDGSWSYQSDLREIHPELNQLTDSFTYTIIDSDGDTSSATQDIIILDGDDPTINNDNNTLVKVYEGDSTFSFDGVNSYDQSDSTSTHQTTSTPTHTLDFTQGSDLVGITSFTFDGVTSTTISSGGSATITTSKGTLQVAYDGKWYYTPPLVYTHDDAADINNFQTTFTYIVTDQDGDHSSTTGSQTIQVDDTFGTIDTTTNVSIDEQYLSNGTNPDATQLIQNGDINLDLTNSKSSSYDVTFNTTQSDSTLNDSALSSFGKDLSYELSNNNHTLVLKDSDNNAVLRVTINNPTSETPTYTATLFQAIDHETDLLENSNIEFDFDIVLTDDDNDIKDGSFKVSIIDDNPQSKDIVLDEDSSITFNSNADATSANTTISTNATYGDATINNDGTITYTPHANFSGSDSFTYDTTLDDGSTTTSTINVTINPITDRAILSVDNSTIQTNEDTAIDLGLNAPIIEDDTDEGSANEDNPEAISEITLSGIPSGAQLLASDGTSLITSTGDDITIILSDQNHIDSATADLTMSINDFETMKILPPSNHHENFSITIAVIEYEVDEDNVPLIGVGSKTTIQSLYVDVLAITDTPTLQIDSNSTKEYTIDEDSTLDLGIDLTESFIDIDGSETKSYTFSMDDGSYLQQGMKIEVDGTVVIVGSSDLSQTISFSGSDPSVKITPAANFSGDIIDLKITLNSLDHDNDSIDANAITQSSSITTTIYVNPQSNDDVNLDNVTTPEDTAIKFLQTLSLNDTDTSETITTIELKNLPSDWVLKDQNDSVVSDRTLDITSIGIDNIKNYTLTPPQNSSTDISLQMDITIDDTQTVNSTSQTDTNTFTHTQTITVTPLSEIKGDQLSTQGDVSLSSISEDSDFVDIFDNLDITNIDTNEITLLNFSNLDIGTQFKYNDGTNDIIKTVTNSTYGVDIPLQYLDSLQFKPAPNISGTQSINMKVKTTDIDDDNSLIQSTQEISSDDILSLDISPVVDSLTINPTDNFGSLNDTFTLNLNAIIEDSSEKVTITLDNFTDDILTFSNTSGTVSYNSGVYTISDIPSNEINDIQFTSSQNINDTINITAKMVESDGSTSNEISSTFGLEIITNDPNATINDDRLLYNIDDQIDALDGEDTLILKQDININFASLDNDDLENFESIDLTQNGDHSLSGVYLSDILGLTDTDNTLQILGDSKDSVQLRANYSGSSYYNTWSTSQTITETIDGVEHTFNIYENSGNSDLELKIEDTIPVSIIQ